MSSPRDVNARAIVVTYEDSRWKQNVSLLTERFGLAGIELLHLEEAEESKLAFSRWLFVGVKNELKGPAVTFESFRGEVKPARFARLVIGSVILSMLNVARAVMKPSWFVEVSRRHHSLTRKHIRALELFVEDDEADILIVLEDDALMVNDDSIDLASLIKFLDSSRPASVVNLCSHFGSLQSESSLNARRPEPSSPFFDTSAAYALNKDAAKILLKTFKVEHQLSFVSADWALTLAARRAVSFSRLNLFLNGSLISGISSLGSTGHYAFRRKVI